MPEPLCKILKIPVMYTCSDLSIRKRENVPEKKNKWSLRQMKPPFKSFDV